MNIISTLHKNTFFCTEKNKENNNLEQSQLGTTFSLSELMLHDTPSYKVKIGILIPKLRLVHL